MQGRLHSLQKVWYTVLLVTPAVLQKPWPTNGRLLATGILIVLLHMSVEDEQISSLTLRPM